MKFYINTACIFNALWIKLRTTPLMQPALSWLLNLREARISILPEVEEFLAMLCDSTDFL